MRGKGEVGNNVEHGFCMRMLATFFVGIFFGASWGLFYGNCRCEKLPWCFFGLYFVFKCTKNDACNFGDC